MEEGHATIQAPASRDDNHNGPTTFNPKNGNIPVPCILDMQSKNLDVAWRKFKRQWQNYEIATRIISEDKGYRKSVFLAVIGHEAFDISEGFSYADGEDENDIEVLIKKFEHFCVREGNEIYETFLFNQRNQEERESVDEYVAALRKLAKTCNFGDKEERMIRDRVVCGVRGDDIRQKLFEDRRLTLSSCIEACRTHVSSHTQAKAIRPGTPDAVDSVKLGRVGASRGLGASGIGATSSGFARRDANNSLGSANNTSRTSFGGDGASSAIVCICGDDAMQLTVQKEGPNTGRQFYRCWKPQGEGCNFFLWADEQDNTSASLSFSSVKCNCGDPAIRLTVKKKGSNNGQLFFGCPKPLGENCDFFQWDDIAKTSGGSSSSTTTTAQKRRRCGLCGDVGHSKKICPHKDGGSSSTSTTTQKQRRCGLCGDVGHSKKICPHKDG